MTGSSGPLLGAVRLPQLWRVDAETSKPRILSFKLAARRLSALSRAELPARDRPERSCPTDALDSEGGARSVDEGGLDVRTAPARGGRGIVLGSTSTPWREPDESERDLLLEGIRQADHLLQEPLPPAGAPRMCGFDARCSKARREIRHRNTATGSRSYGRRSDAPARRRARLRPELRPQSAASTSPHRPPSRRARPQSGRDQPNETEEAIGAPLREVEERLDFLSRSDRLPPGERAASILPRRGAVGSARDEIARVVEPCTSSTSRSARPARTTRSLSACWSVLRDWNTVMVVEAR